MRIVVASDHAAIDLRGSVVKHLRTRGHEVVEHGPQHGESADYPVFGAMAAEQVASGDCELGIVMCGTGIGISLAANKVKGIRCGCVSEPYSAALSRQHNNANMVAFGARVVGEGLATMIVDAFLDASFEGGRHARRVGQLTDIEEGREPTPPADASAAAQPC